MTLLSSLDDYIKQNLCIQLYTTYFLCHSQVFNLVIVVAAAAADVVVVFWLTICVKHSIRKPNYNNNENENVNERGVKFINIT